jgi:hypothetical protein
MNRRRAWILATVSLALLLYGTAMQYESRGAKFAKSGEQLYLQLVQIETPRHAADVADLLRADLIGTPDANLRLEQIEQYRVSTEWDNLLLMLYPLQLIAVCAFAGFGSKRLAIVASALIVLGGFCDWQENRHIFEVLRQPSPFDPTVDALRHWSLAKWTLDGAAWLSASIALHRSIFSAGVGHINRWRIRVVTVAFLIAGALSVCGGLSFLTHWDYRALLAESVVINALAVIGCVFRPS